MLDEYCQEKCAIILTSKRITLMHAQVGLGYLLGLRAQPGCCCCGLTVALTTPSVMYQVYLPYQLPSCPGAYLGT